MNRFNEAQENSIAFIHRNTLEIIRKKYSNGEKIHVAFFVFLEEIFPSESLFQEMNNDNFFVPTIVILPNVFRGKREMQKNLYKAQKYYSSKYSQILLAYDFKKDEPIDISSDFDIVISQLPNANNYAPIHQLQYLIQKNILPVLIPYGYTISNYYLQLLKIIDFLFYWKIYLENDLAYTLYKNNSPSQGRNAHVVGSCKMDMYREEKRSSKRKTIIIAPHHTVREYKNSHDISLSTFMIYKDFYFELAQTFTECDFILRPHPLLFTWLEQKNIMSKEEIQEYLNKIKSFSNISLDSNKDFFNTFANSDALIHDCGSFLAEYMFTLKPACYLMNDNTLNSLNIFGKQCVTQHYLAYTKEDIINFIKDIVILEKDVNKKQRLDFFEKELKQHYPYTGRYILNQLKEQIQN